MRSFSLPLPTLFAGFVAVLVGYASSAAIIWQAAAAAGATPGQIAGWMTALGLAMGISTLALSAWRKVPVLTAWSTPGAALLVSGLQGVTLAEAVGIFIFANALIVICGATGLFARLMKIIPHSLAAAMLAILLVTRRLRPLGAKDHLCCLLQGCCVFCFNFWCFYTAAAWINTGLESVIFSMAVLFNAINSFLFFRQQPPGRFWAAAALGLAGIVILFWDDLLANGLNASLLWGIGLSALGTYGFSLGNMFSIRHQRRGLETLTTNSWAMLYGTLVMGAIALLRGDNFMPEWTVSYLGALLYLALFGSVIAFGAYFTLVGRIGASKAAYSTLLFPLVALSISTVYEGYVWHSSAVIGLALILLGNLVMFAKPEQLLLRRRLA
ncbi:benzoate/H(+) symporter BenE family transporter [Klebsiella pneumoniae]|nr:benzoate/H(+) symporter BenE family transporter [Klebsiella pneumoniae]